MADRNDRLAWRGLVFEPGEWETDGMPRHRNWYARFGLWELTEWDTTDPDYNTDFNKDMPWSACIVGASDDDPIDGCKGDDPVEVLEQLAADAQDALDKADEELKRAMIDLIGDFAWTRNYRKQLDRLSPRKQQ